MLQPVHCYATSTKQMYVVNIRFVKKNQTENFENNILSSKYTQGGPNFRGKESGG